MYWRLHVMPCFIVSIFTAFAVGSAQQGCVAARTAPALDHAILAVGDLDGAAAGFSTAGFRLKPGRLHASGLLNRHIKFRDGTSIELMTVRGEPGDSLAADYAQLLATSTSPGVYVGLTIADLDATAPATKRLGLAVQHRRSGSMRFVSFPAWSPAAAVFFGSPGLPVGDPDSVVTHAMAVTGLAEAWVEGGGVLGELLATLGAAACGTARAPDGRTGERWSLARGHIVVVAAPSETRPRVLGVVLRGEPGRAAIVTPYPGFWIRVESDPR